VKTPISYIAWGSKKKSFQSFKPFKSLTEEERQQTSSKMIQRYSKKVFAFERCSRTCLALSIIALLQSLPAQNAFAAEKFICILGGTGTRHAIPVLAASFGLYPKYGLDATIVRIGSGTVATAALLGGEADVINTSGPALINARLLGTPVSYVSNFNNWSDAHLLVRPEVTSMEQLRSGKFAVPGLGGGYAHMLRAFFFPKFGLDQGAKQPTILSAGDTPSALAGVVSRQYDAALASYENYMAFRKRGLKALVFPEDVNVRWYTGLITLEKKIKERRGAMIQFIKAQIETISIIKKDPIKARAALKNYFRSSDDELMAEYQKYLAVKLPLVTRVDTDNIKTLLLTSTNPAAKNAKPEEFIDNSLVDDIVREGFIKQFER
jgi:ABC-type nitrate/sulfonate/bicarbonate transport system substrate-binding protein